VKRPKRQHRTDEAGLGIGIEARTQTGSMRLMLAATIARLGLPRETLSEIDAIVAEEMAKARDRTPR
jgi:hypothetical protein